MNINDLLKSGKLLVGDQLIWNRRSLKVVHKATIGETGDIRLDDGRKFKTVSGAARALNNGRPVDGWIAWKLVRTGHSIGELRKK